MNEQTVSRFDLREYGDISIAIISDSHGDVDQRVRSIVNNSDVVIHAGDIMGAGALNRLNPKCDVVIAVLGNNDCRSTWRDDAAGRLDELDDIALVDLQGGQIAVEHGHHLHDIKRNHFPLAYKYPESRMVIYGHTHVQRLDRQQRPWLVNPGASGAVRNHDGASCYRLQVSGHDWSLERFKFRAFECAC